MSLLLRKIDLSDPWLKGLDEEATAPPIWAVRSFMPSQKEGNEISLHEVADEDEALRVAAAWGMLKDDPAKGNIAFAWAERVALEKAGLTLRETPGDLHHAFSDAQHRDLVLPDQASVTQAAAVFLEGDVYSFEGRVVAKALEAEIRVNAFEMAAIAGKGSTTPAPKNLLKFIRDKICEVHGVAA